VPPLGCTKRKYTMKNTRKFITRLVSVLTLLAAILGCASAVLADEIDMNDVLERIAAAYGITESDYTNYESNYAASLPTEFVQDADSVYVALGGTTAGGLAVVDYEDSYPDLFAARRDLPYDTQYINHGENGLTGAGAVSYVRRFASDIRTADLITFQLDGAPFISSCMTRAIDGVQVNWSGYVTDSELLSYISSFRSRMVTEYSPKYGQKNAEKIAVALEHILYECLVYCIETVNAVNEIRALNGDAVIVTLGLYNPLRGLVFKANDGSSVDVGAKVDQMIDFCNVFLLKRISAMQKAAFIDVSGTPTEGYGEINVDVNNENSLSNELYSVVSKASSQYANAEGHKYIFERLDAALAEACPHTVTKTLNGREASCTAEGYTGDTVCAKCGFVKSYGSVIPVKDHAFGEWNVIAAPSCTARGEESRSCSVCGKTEVKYQSPADHSFDEGKVTREPTCDRDGERTVSCTACGLTKSSSIPAVGHKWDEGKVTAEATCDKAGTRAVTCSNCGKATVTAIPAKGHSFDKGTVTLKPTCTEDGERTFACSSCSTTKKAPIPAKGHSFDGGKITKEATCTEDGERAVSCKSCKISTTAVIPAKGHSFDEGKITKEPTCDRDGEKTITCTVCKHTATEAVAAKGHSFGEGKVTKEATCTEDGVRSVICTVCKLATTEVIPAKGHAFNGGSVTKEPTCTEEGVKAVTCTVCGIATTEAIPAKGHAFDEGSVTKEPTCTEEGAKAVTCTVCGIATTEAIPAKGHTFDEGSVTKTPTCTEEGEKAVTCTACGIATTDVIPPTGHRFEEYISNEDANCKDNGTKTAVCASCGAIDTIEDEGSRTDDHAYGDDGVCSVCGAEKENASDVMVIVIVSVLILCAAGVALFFVLRKKKTASEAEAELEPEAETKE